MFHSNALWPWPAEVDEEVVAACEPIYDSFGCASLYVQAMWGRVCEAQGALGYYGSSMDLNPVVDFLMFVQNKLYDHGIEVAGAAQQAVYDTWFAGESLRRERRRSLSGLALVARDPGVAHVP